MIAFIHPIKLMPITSARCVVFSDFIYRPAVKAQAVKTWS